MAPRKHLIAILLLLVGLSPILLGATLRLSGGTLSLPSGCVTDDAIATNAAVSIAKFQHLYKPSTNFDLAIGGTPTTKEQLVFVASTSGTIHGFHWMLNDTGSSTSIAWDLKKNGTTVLTGTGSSTHADTDGQIKDGTLSTTTFNAGDRFSIVETVTSATGAQGPFAWAELEEAAP